MRKLLVLMMLTLSANAQAGETPFYVGGGIGFSNLQFDGSFINVPPPFEAPQFSIDGETLGAQLFVGIDLIDSVSFEAGYIYFGNNDSDNVLYDGPPTSIDDPVNLPVNLDIDLDGVYLEGIYHWNATDDTSIDFMLGGIYARSEAENSVCCGVMIALPAESVSDEEFGIKAGIGLTVEVSDSFDVRVAANYFDLDADDTIESPYRVGVDVVWDF